MIRTKRDKNDWQIRKGSVDQQCGVATGQAPVFVGEFRVHHFLSLSVLILLSCASKYWVMPGIC